MLRNGINLTHVLHNLWHDCRYNIPYTSLLYFTLVGVVSSDVSRSSCTTSFTPCCSIFSQSYVFFQGCPCPLLDVIDVLHPGAPPSSCPRHHSENACLCKITPIVSACMSKERHFSFDNFGKEVLFEVHPTGMVLFVFFSIQLIRSHWQ